MKRTEGGLAGRTIVVTRPVRQAAALAAMIEGAGGCALRFPLIEIEPVNSRELDALVDALESFDLAIFVSRNAVEQGFDRVRARRPWPPGIAVAAIGEGTRRALAEQGIETVLSSEGPADSEALLGHPGMTAFDRKRVVIFRGMGGRELLGTELRARGAYVAYAECYRRTMPTADPGPVRAGLARGALDAVVISSGEGLANLVHMLGDDVRNLMSRVQVFIPHRRLVEKARAIGIPAPKVAGPADADVIEALVAYFRRAG